MATWDQSTYTRDPLRRHTSFVILRQTNVEENRNPASLRRREFLNLSTFQEAASCVFGPGLPLLQSHACEGKLIPFTYNNDAEPPPPAATVSHQNSRRRLIEPSMEPSAFTYTVEGSEHHENLIV